ncbi:KAT8 regulatory NSL complex subunit 1 [Trichomycterus rosablanca]|uniref:KAT8 regulatory NSL complex subunit 1 n=1 Tax=Trichomycterus rosablanca TaxID=2290929 RepID=UPI002F3593D3
MYYYCNRSKMSAAGPAAEGPQSCCGGGGGGGAVEGAEEGGGGGCGELVNGKGDREIRQTSKKARSVSQRESATCNAAHATRKSRAEDGSLLNGVKSGKCAAHGQEDHGYTVINPERNGGLRGSNLMEAGRTTTRTGMRAFQKADAAVSKRRGCSFSRASKRACFSGNLAGNGPNLAETFRDSREEGSDKNDRVERAEMNACACSTTKGRVRLYRVRSFLTGLNGNSSQLTNHEPCELKQPQRPKSMHKSSSDSLPLSPSEAPDGGSSSPVMNGTTCTRVEAGATELGSIKQLEEAHGQAKKRQLQLEERTDTLWRRLHAVQVQQVERHVGQQLGDLRKAIVAPRSTELSRLARSCNEALRPAEVALDSDHTASSSGGSSGSEEEEEENDEESGRHGLPSHVKSGHINKEWQWMKERAWLGSRWVWLQAQVSELEYRIRALTALYTHLRQGKLRAAHSVPETPLRAPRPSPASNDCRSLSAGDPLRKRLTEESAISSQTLPNPNSSAARVRPLLRQRRHRLIRLEQCTELRSKAVTLPCACELPAVCVLCAPSRHPAEKENCETGLDQFVHPVLSMPSDCGMPLLSGTQSCSAMRWMSETASSSWLRRRSQGSQKVGRARRRLICPRPPSTLPPLFNSSGGSNCRNQRRLLSHRAADLSPLPVLPPATDTPIQRRRRGESSFDIDNLVMPLGLAGLGARVQKLQYKEIITPSWRELDSVCGAAEKLEGSDVQGPNQVNTPHQPNGGALEDEDEVEDLSDAVFLKRHAVWESRERSRWGSWARRRRRGRTSSCYGDGKSCRGLEQTSCSPERDLEKGSPCSPLFSGADDPFYQMEDEQQSTQPWERRSFPLLDPELRWLQEDEEPEEDPCAASGRSQSTDSGISVGSLELSPGTPLPHQQHSGGRKPAASTTQDSDSQPLSITSPTLLSFQLPSLSSHSAHKIPSTHRISRSDSTLL